MIPAAVLLALLTVQRLSELLVSARNTKALIRAGASERAPDQYPFMIALHATWLVSLWLLAWSRDVRLWWIPLLALLQVSRFWTIRTLGSRWTTRIIIPRNASPLVSGPYRFVRHPNYLIVAVELPCISLALGLAWHAVFFGALNLAMLSWRIREEDRGLYSSFRRS